jgi:hypothetical protein
LVFQRTQKRILEKQLDAEQLDAEQLDAEQLDAELDAEQLDAEQMDAEQLDAEQLDAEQLLQLVFPQCLHNKGFEYVEGGNTVHFEDGGCKGIDSRRIEDNGWNMGMKIRQDLAQHRQNHLSH